MSNQNVAQIIARFKQDEGASDGLRIANHPGVALGAAKSGPEKTEQSGARLRAEVGRVDDAVERRGIGGQPLENLLAGLLRGSRLESAAQFEGRIRYLLMALRLLLIDDAAVDFRHGGHALLHDRDQIGLAVFARSIPFDRALQNAQAGFGGRQAVSLLAVA